MKIMPVKFVPVKNQKFNIRKVINPIECSKCTTCNYMKCPNHNYMVRCYLYKYSPEEFFDFYKEDLLNLILYKPQLNLKVVAWTPEFLNSFIMECIKFPKNRYFEVDVQAKNIYIYKKTKYREPYKIMRIEYDTKRYFYSPNRYGEEYKQQDEVLAAQILNKYNRIEGFILNYKEFRKRLEVVKEMEVK